ncbi:MAG TPA: hypothetical protein VMA13_09210 [Candidatus Saccharimonadales bacterium]|nr:hypothetical protein [Candidatus Saccharimonadales bacterium]
MLINSHRTRDGKILYFGGAHPPRVRFDAPRVGHLVDEASASTREGACAPHSAAP